MPPSASVFRTGVLVPGAALALLLACTSASPSAPSAPVPPPSPFLEVAPVAAASGPAATAFLAVWGRTTWDDAALATVDAAAGAAPPPYLALVRGQALLGIGRATEAAEVLASVDPTSTVRTEALAWRARALIEAGDTDAARAALDELLGAADPWTGGAVALAARAGLGGDPEPYWHRLWMYYPSEPEAVAIEARIGTVTWREASHRAETLMATGAWQDALDVLEPHLAAVTGVDEDACRVRYVHGRSLFKRNRRPAASVAFGTAGRDCAATSYGPSIAYTAARNEHIRNRHLSAAAAWRLLVEVYPDHRFADDGLVNAGISLERAGDVAAARAAWDEAATRYPDGDMVPEGMFRSAWSLYIEGRADEARAVAARLGALPITTDAEHVEAGRYWAARWALYPGPAPSSRRADQLEAAVAGWRTLVQQRPWSYYGVLARARLASEAPEALPTPVSPPTRPSSWTFRREAWKHPARQAAAALLGLGLVDRAAAEWARVDPEPTGPERWWWYASLLPPGDAPATPTEVAAHAELRGWVKSHPPADGDPGASIALDLAYPDRWLAQVRTAAASRPLSPRFFHALVRVESNFDPGAVSWAGARGLCQVMPATGRTVGKWLGEDVSADDLLDPTLNLRVGARYLVALNERFDDSPYLAAAGYNAGETRVEQWLGEWGNLPTDEFVERIPFDETRGYVKSVVGTWATYLWLRGEPLPDLHRYDHHAVPGRATP